MSWLANQNQVFEFSVTKKLFKSLTILTLGVYLNLLNLNRKQFQCSPFVVEKKVRQVDRSKCFFYTILKAAGCVTLHS